MELRAGVIKLRQGVPSPFEKPRGGEEKPDFVTFMQHGPKKGSSKAIFGQIGVERRRGEGMVSGVNGRFPVADGRGEKPSGEAPRPDNIGKRGLTTFGFGFQAGRRIESVKNQRPELLTGGQQ